VFASCHGVIGCDYSNDNNSRASVRPLNGPWPKGTSFLLNVSNSRDAKVVSKTYPHPWKGEGRLRGSTLARDSLIALFLQGKFNYLCLHSIAQLEDGERRPSVRWGDRPWIDEGYPLPLFDERPVEVAEYDDIAIGELGCHCLVEEPELGGVIVERYVAPLKGMTLVPVLQTYPPAGDLDHLLAVQLLLHLWRIHVPEDRPRRGDLF